MDTIIVDSSVIVKWLNQTKEDSIKQADRILHDALEKRIELLTTELAKYEIGNTLIKKNLSPAEAYVSLGTVSALPITFVTESEDLARETFSLAYEYKLTYYDASFLSLAKQYNAPLVTENVKHQGRSSNISVIPLKDY